VSAERIKSWPTKERPRERLLAEGPERLTDADLLAIILRIGAGTFREGVPGTNAYEATRRPQRESLKGTFPAAASRAKTTGDKAFEKHPENGPMLRYILLITGLGGL
jgi:hypothetical protein